MFLFHVCCSKYLFVYLCQCVGITKLLTRNIRILNKIWWRKLHCFLPFLSKAIWFLIESAVSASFHYRIAPPAPIICTHTWQNALAAVTFSTLRLLAVNSGVLFNFIPLQFSATLVLIVPFTIIFK